MPASARNQPAAEEAEDSRRAVQSVEVGGRLLLALAESPGALPLKELAARAGLVASRAHPYLVSFQRLGLVEQEAGSGYYALGAAALQIGLACLHQLDPLKAAEPAAQELAHSTGYAVAIAVWGNFGPTIVRLIEAQQPLHIMLRVGSVMSVLGTATGRAFAAALPTDMLERAVTLSQGQEVGATRVGAKAWRKEVEEVAAEVKRHGVSRAAGRPIPGVNAFSAAAFDHEGHCALVLTALDHEDRLKADWNGAGARAVRDAAAAITRRLGGAAAR
ncbi:IclR family transcriptional regulator [Ramlibacter alkalitolerans]|uniref:IclR family transcriptional regulator n=1 Tax=Ramlibacter alkalitolerans TaxID=2039631 RepID=A0ABS1JJG1_9BURK|nr:IclR family transcriptional regulator [Ramlibacter alkalitolerans]MBL0424066.1 IclR family transcriptional regulator [Ramlibacter alkalitolerans]